MKRKQLILILISAVCLSAVPGVMAQETPDLDQAAPSLATLQISLWPEFDRPDVLVIYRGLLAADTPLPVPVEFAIPADVGDLHALAYVDESGQRLNLTSTSRVEGQERIFSFELPALAFQLEYYDPLPVDETGQRSYTFGYQADYAVRDLSVEVLEPPTASNFVLEPPADSVVPEGSLVYHVAQVGALAVDEARTWTLRYDKDNADLTISMMQQEQPPSALPTAASPVEGDTSTVLLFFVAFVALVAVGAVAFWLGRRTGNEEEPPLDASFPARKKRQGPARGQGAFCHRCGTQLRSDSEYCHKCGTQVRGLDTRTQ